MNQYIYDMLSRIRFLVTLKRIIDKIEFQLWSYRHTYRKWLRNYFVKPRLTDSKRFCILCVKRTEYVDFAIAQINSLHFYNPFHVVDIVCDVVCLKYFEARRLKLDYPKNTTAVVLAKKVPGPWQRLKIKALLYAVEHDAILVDADMFWYTDPHFDTHKVTFFAQAYLFKDQDNEQKIICNIFRQKKWCNFSHFTTGVVYIPYLLYSKRMRSLLRSMSFILLTNPFVFIREKSERTKVRRLADEIAINLSIQSIVKSQCITTLKGTDSPGDRRIVLSLYYGSMNRIIS